MTGTAATTTAPSRRAVAVVAAGCAALVARPLLPNIAVDQTALLLSLFAVLLVVGICWPLPKPADGRRSIAASVVITIGIGAFLIGRIVSGAHSAGPFTARFVALNAFAALAEEAFFRRFLYGVLEPYGTGYAVMASSLLFAVVHLTVYGPWVLPIDLAAGLMLGWQRAVSGSWGPPAVTHIVANVLAVL